MQRTWAMVFAALVGCSDEPAPPADDDGAAGGAAGAGGHQGGHDGGHGGDGGGGGCVDTLPPDRDLPELLSATGLYADIEDKTVAAYARPFAPQFQLWSDGAEKSRWIYLPECGAAVDTSDMDEWSLPVGTRFWKEFSVGGARIETRLIERVGPGPHDFLMTAYLWNAGETEAVRTPDGLADALGTAHDVPDETACRRCHGSYELGGGRPSRALGFSALQLGAGIDAFRDALSAPPSGSFAPPGDAVESAALGYLHANCGHCHNATADAVPQVDLRLWLEVDDAAVIDTGAYSTAVGVPNAIFNDLQVTARIEPGDPAASAVWFRMNERGNNAEMPPVASESVDAVGAAAVSAWIEALP